MSWTCLSNYGHVLVELSVDRRHRIRDLARRLDLTERAVQRIITELDSAGLVVREREGRCNVYTLNRDHPLVHPREAHCTVGEFVDAFRPRDRGETDAADASAERGESAGNTEQSLGAA